MTIFPSDYARGTAGRIKVFAVPFQYAVIIPSVKDVKIALRVVVAPFATHYS